MNVLLKLLNYRFVTSGFHLLTTIFEEVASKLFGETEVRQTSIELHVPTMLEGEISSKLTVLLKLQ